MGEVDLPECTLNDAVIAETEHSISDNVEILPFSVLTDIEIMPYTEHISFSGV